MVSRISQGIKNFAAWTQDGLWRVRLADVQGPRRIYLRWLRILLLTVKEFQGDSCGLRASALTFYSVLSVVPVAAMAFGIAKGFGFEQRLERTIRDNLQGQEQAAELIIGFSRDQLAQAQGGVVAGVGIMFLLWTVIRLLSNIEMSFNEIWHVTKPRTWPRKFSDYLAVLLIAPIVIIFASSLTVYISSTVAQWTESLKLWGVVSAPILLGVRLLPGTLLWALFTFMYMFLPNTRVNFVPALIAGILAGTLYQVIQALYVYFQIGVSNYSAIYGSLAALPLFLIWMQLSWTIVLFGAEFAYARQHVDDYEFLDDEEHLSASFRRLFALGIVQVCLRELTRGNPPPDAAYLAEELKAPSSAVNVLLEDLVGTGLLAEAATGDDRHSGYLPALPPEQLTIAQVLGRLDGRGGPDLPLAETEDLQRLRDALEAYEQAPAESGANRALAEL